MYYSLHRTFEIHTHTEDTCSKICLGIILEGKFTYCFTVGYSVTLGFTGELEIKMSLIYYHNKSYETLEDLSCGLPSFLHIRVVGPRSRQGVKVVPHTEMKSAGVGEVSRIWTYQFETPV